MATTALGPDETFPPFPIGRLTSAPWREQALARMAGQRFVLDWLKAHPDTTSLSPAMEQTIRAHWDAAAATAKDRYSPRGASVTRVTSHLDEVETDLLRVAPISYLAGQLPGLVVSVQGHLPVTDPRRHAVEQRAKEIPRSPLTEADRELLVAAHHAATSASQREVTRLRSFQRLITIATALLFVGAIAIAFFAFGAPGRLPLCFNPDNYIVCPTSATKIPNTASGSGANAETNPISQDRVDSLMRKQATGWDMAVVEGVGLVAAALAAAIALRGIRGTSSPFGLPVVLGVLKLPTGALTAVFGLLLMRGDFIPGLSALDTSAQIIAWAVLFGYSQQLLTRFVDERAQNVLDSVGHNDAHREPPHVPPVTPHPNGGPHPDGPPASSH